MKSRLLLLLVSVLSLTMFACSSDDNSLIGPVGSDTSQLDSDSSSGGDSDTDTDTDSDSDTDGDTDGDNYLIATYRDFKSTHTDFERFYPDGDNPDEYDGPEKPCLNMVLPDLGADKTPQFNTAQKGTCDEDRGDGWIINFNHIESATSFADWYHDVDGVNIPIEKKIFLTLQSDGTYLFEDDTFFPLGVDEGFGAEDGQVDKNGTAQNFLFTTEIHTAFTYEGGEVFTFTGDDDLWLFIDDKLAVDIGGLHEKTTKSVNLDDLGLSKGTQYNMDIFHAERHTTDSNFRITTTIKKFITSID
ncbi:MAG: fibro-slime domain-containing protein [Deltaproteobacteria bacterium]|nr:fibro-slime domain-containing protein [Deltaproteobacteria bacterium]